MKLKSLLKKSDMVWISGDNVDELKFLLWELFQISKWINDSLNSWNSICAVILLRTLAERIILFRIILKDKIKANEQMWVYINHGKIIAYVWMKRNIMGCECKEYYNDCENTYNREHTKYLCWKKYNLYKWLLPNEKSISFDNLYRNYIWESLMKYDINQDESFYEIFCHIHHGNSLNIFLLNQSSPFEMSSNKKLEETINNFTHQFLLLIFEIFWEQEANTSS